jgi:DNA (cytosine-5)-methyltransferase 1
VSAYYNEIDPYAAQWLRNLIAGGHIAAGDVDERSIVDVPASDIRGYTQCHFFAGIAGWSLALRLAGWPDDRPVWTGSCPCQPFSAAGKGQASGDERHLWPHWFELIRACRPPVIFGEQVEAAIGWGWLDLVHSDMDAEGYAVGAAVLPACSIGAPHIRQRLWFVADAMPTGRSPWWAGAGDGQTARISGAGELADAAGTGAERDNREEASTGCSCRSEPSKCGGTGELAEPKGEQSHGSRNSRRGRREPTDANPWSDLVWLPCTDGKSRPTQPGIFPLVAGLSVGLARVRASRVAKLRAAGNAIVPQVAAEFIRATL